MHLCAMHKIIRFYAWSVNSKEHLLINFKVEIIATNENFTDTSSLPCNKHNAIKLGVITKGTAV